MREFFGQNVGAYFSYAGPLMAAFLYPLLKWLYYRSKGIYALINIVAGIHVWLLAYLIGFDWKAVAFFVVANICLICLNRSILIDVKK